MNKKNLCDSGYAQMKVNFYGIKLMFLCVNLTNRMYKLEYIGCSMQMCVFSVYRFNYDFLRTFFFLDGHYIM